MDWKTWLKGLGVFVLSAFVTSLAAVKISPSTFNLNAEGLKNLSLLVGVIGVKAVLLYLKQSPLKIAGQIVNASNPGFKQGGFVRIAALQMLLPAVLTFALVITPIAGMMVTTGCSLSQVQAGIADVEAKLPQFVQIASGLIQLVAPEYAPIVQPISSAIQVSGVILSDAIKGYQSSPSASALQKINASFQAARVDTNKLTSIPGVDVHTQAIATATAGLLGLTLNDIAAWTQTLPPVIVSQLPAFYGWHIGGVDLVALDGNKLPSPIAGKTKHSGYTSDDIAAHWNKLCGQNDKAKIHKARKHVFWLVPVPGTGHK